MKGTILGAVVVLALSIVPLQARAYVTFDAVVPDSPVAGETVFARLSAGICDGIIDEKGYPQIIQTGNAVRVLIETASFEDPIFCNFDSGSFDMPFGSFPPGTYTLQVDRHYVQVVGPDVIETVGTRTFVVRGSVSEPNALPMLSSGSLLLIFLGFLGTAGMALARRQVVR